MNKRLTARFLCAIHFNGPIRRFTLERYHPDWNREANQGDEIARKATARAFPVSQERLCRFYLAIQFSDSIQLVISMAR